MSYHLTITPNIYAIFVVAAAVAVLLVRAVAGFYCSHGSVTSDPFRNDTTLRPYACSPGSYCLGGVGFLEVRSGDYLYAQLCPAGFFCETARCVFGNTKKERAYGRRACRLILSITSTETERELVETDLFGHGFLHRAELCV